MTDNQTTEQSGDKSSANLFMVGANTVSRIFPKQKLFVETRASESLHTDTTDFISFHKPTELLVSRHFPGYRVFELTGRGADEALGHLLADSLDSETALESFRTLLATPEIASSIIAKLFPRSVVTLKRGKYYLSEAMVAQATDQVLTPHEAGPNLKAAMAHVITRVLTTLQLVLPVANKKIAVEAPRLALTMADLKAVILVESLRDIFSEARLAEVGRALDAEATPDLIGEKIGTMLRQASHSIPEIRLRMEQLEMVQVLIQHYYKNPTSLTNTMRANTTLATLAGYANFLVDSVKRKLPPLSPAANADMREACASVLTILQAAPSIEPMPLSRYAELFGVVPCAASDGVHWGAVVYLPRAQQSSLHVLNVYPKPDGADLALVPSEYVPIASIAPEIARSVTSIEAVHGIANLIADEVVTGPDVRVPYTDQPILRAFGVDEDALAYLALAKTEGVAVAAGSEKGSFHLIYSTRISEHWRSRLGAATPTFGYFDDVASLLIYQLGSVAQLPNPMAQRKQSIELTAAFDTFYQGNIVSKLQSNLGKPFTFSIELKNPNSSQGVTVLKPKIQPLELLLGPDGRVDPKLAHYAALSEPGVDSEVATMLALCAAYSGSNESYMRDRAQSWIVETLTPLATHPAIARVAIKALNQAVIDAKLDARKLAVQYKEAVVKAYFGTALAVLMRFGKVDDELVKQLLSNLPMGSLTVKAALSLATLPEPINGRI